RPDRGSGWDLRAGPGRLGDDPVPRGRSGRQRRSPARAGIRVARSVIRGGGVSEEERYLFDLMRYLVVDDVLSPPECAKLNALVDDLDLWGRATRGERAEIHEHNHAWAYRRETWAEPFRRLLAHPTIVPYLIELVGPKFRYDHG